jgi:hypothetical protein
MVPCTGANDRTAEPRGLSSGPTWLASAASAALVWVGRRVGIAAVRRWDLAMMLAASVSIIAGDSNRPTDRLAWIVAALCMLGLILTLSGTSLGALLFVAAIAVFGVIRADRCLHLIARWPGLWAIPAFAAISTIWSTTPLVTLRATAELAITVGGASLCAAFLRPREFLAAMSVGLFICAVLSLAFGRYALDGLTGETVFIGVFESKNTMAAFMSFLAIVSAAVLADRGQPTLLRPPQALSRPSGLPWPSPGCPRPSARSC